LEHTPSRVTPEIGFDQGIGDAGERCRLDREAKKGRKPCERRNTGIGKTACPVGHPARIEAVHLADHAFGGEAVDGRHKLGDPSFP